VQDEKLGEVTKKYVDWAHDVDEAIGIACLKYERNTVEGMDALKQLNAEARKFDNAIYTDLPKAIREMRNQGSSKRKS
jgi:hypothetical protein